MPALKQKIFRGNMTLRIFLFLGGVFVFFLLFQRTAVCYEVVHEVYEVKVSASKDRGNPEKKGDESLGSEISESRAIRYSLLTYPEADHDHKVRLFVILHPAGETAEDYLEDWKDQAVKYQTMLLAPQREMVYERKSPEVSAYLELVQEICRSYAVDPEKIYIIGTSAGALIGTWLVQEAPALWSGAVFVAGFGFKDALVGIPLEQEQYELYPPLLYVHGWKDTETLKGVLIGIEMLVDKGVSVELYDYEDAGHEHRREWNPRIFDWIEKVEQRPGRIEAAAPSTENT